MALCCLTCASLFKPVLYAAHAPVGEYTGRHAGRSDSIFLQGLWIDVAALARALTAKQLPHLKWSDRKPPLLEFMVHAELRKA